MYINSTIQLIMHQSLIVVLIRSLLIFLMKQEEHSALCSYWLYKYIKKTENLHSISGNKESEEKNNPVTNEKLAM